MRRPIVHAMKPGVRWHTSGITAMNREYTKMGFPRFSPSTIPFFHGTDIMLMQVCSTKVLWAANKVDVAAVFGQFVFQIHISKEASLLLLEQNSAPWEKYDIPESLKSTARRCFGPHVRDEEKNMIVDLIQRNPVFDAVIFFERTSTTKADEKPDIVLASVNPKCISNTRYLGPRIDVASPNLHHMKPRAGVEHHFH